MRIRLKTPSRKRDNTPGAKAYLFDTLVSDEYGGTGESLTWQRIPDHVARPVFLAGGLNADNVCDAVTRTATLRCGCEFGGGGVEGNQGCSRDPKIHQRGAVMYRNNVTK